MTSSPSEEAAAEMPDCDAGGGTSSAETKESLESAAEGEMARVVSAFEQRARQQAGVYDALKRADEKQRCERALDAMREMEEADKH